MVNFIFFLCLVHIPCIRRYTKHSTSDQRGFSKYLHQHGGTKAYEKYRSGPGLYNLNRAVCYFAIMQDGTTYTSLSWYSTTRSSHSYISFPKYRVDRKMYNRFGTEMRSAPIGGVLMEDEKRAVRRFLWYTRLNKCATGVVFAMTSINEIPSRNTLTNTLYMVINNL